MEKYLVKNLMVPISEYATVSEGATLFEAALALEKAQEEFKEDRYSHRAVLILDKAKRVIGKLSQWDFVRALERKNGQDGGIGDIGKFGFSSKAILVHKRKHRVKSISGEEIISIAANSKVKDFMQTYSDGECIDENTSLDTAFHQFTMGLHLALLVSRGKDIVGILRLSDVFAAAFHAMKKSELKE